MCHFSTGLLAGTLLGAGLILTVHPMNKRAMRKAYRRASKMMDRVNHSLSDWT